MNVVQWNVSKEGGPAFGTAKYEQKLYENIDGDADVRRVQRRDGSLVGNMPISWVERYRRYDADLIHATFQTVAPASFIHSPENFVVTVHDLAPLVYLDEVRDASLKLQWRLTPPALRKADEIIAISEFTKEEIIRLMDIHPSKISVVHQGVNHELYRPMNKSEAREHFGLDPDGTYILVVSSDLEHKRVGDVREIIDRVREDCGDAKVLKAGYGQSLDGESVINTGWVSEEDMPVLYNAADLYLHPSEYEGFGLPVLEAIACGTPVVARKVASIPEIIGDCCDLARPNANPEELGTLVVEKIQGTVDEAGLVARSKQFSWEKTAQETYKVYQNLM